MDRDNEQVDRESRGRRIFEALRRGRPEDAEDAPEPGAQASPSDESEPPASAGSEGAPEPSVASDAAVETTAEPPAQELADAEGAPGAALPGVTELERHLGVSPAPPPPPEPEPAPPTTQAPQEPAPGEPAPGEPAHEAAGEAMVAESPAESPVPTPPPEPEPEVELGEPPPAPQPARDRPRPSLPRVMAIANQKGGVGKTTTAVNLGAALAELGFRTLIIDLDPQGNATTGLGIDIRNLETTVYDCLMADTPLEDCIEATSVRNLFVAPSNMDLAGAEIELVPMFSRELKLRRSVEGVKDDYDFVLIDCPPSLGLLTVNGLAAADDVVVPIQCEYYALEGLGQLVNNVQLVRSNLNPVLDVRGIVLTMYDARTKLADQVVDEVRRHFGERVYDTIVPRTVRLSEAPSFGQPIIVFDSSSRGSDAYRALALEVSGGPPGGQGIDTANEAVVPAGVEVAGD